MRWYAHVHAAVQRVLPTLRATQAANLALLVGALLARHTLNLSDRARAYPAPATPHVARPKLGLLHRVKRLWRFLDNARVDAVAIQAAFIPRTVAALGSPRLLGLAIDWTMFDTVLPFGARMRYQVLRVAVPRCGRALPLVQVAYDRDALPADRGQSRLGVAALLAVLRALPPGVRPVVLADRGFARAPFLAWLQRQGAAFVVRVTQGCVGRLLHPPVDPGTRVPGLPDNLPRWTNRPTQVAERVTEDLAGALEALHARLRPQFSRP